MTTFKSNLAACAVALAGMLALPAQAQTGQPLRIVSGFPPGGAVDTLARVVGEHLRVSLNQPVLIENRPGASTMLAMGAVKDAAPDGQTILINFSPAFTMFPYTYAKLNYDPQRDFVPVSQLVKFPLALSAGASQPYKDFAGYRDWVKADPTRAAVGMPGLGTSAHFAVLELGKAIGVEITPVSYKGGAAIMADEMGGHIGAGIDSIASKLELYRAGRLNLLGITGTERSSLAPDVPTLAEMGVKGLDYPSGWYGAFAPANTPPDVIDKLSRALSEAVRDPSVQKKLTDIGLEVTGTTAAELKETIRTDNVFWKPVIEASGFTAIQ